MEPPADWPRRVVTSVQEGTSNEGQFTAPSGIVPVCPLACAKSPCPWKCPTLLRDAVDEWLYELAVSR